MTVRRFVLLAVIGVLAGVAVWLPGRLGGGGESDGAAPPLGATSASPTGTSDVIPPTAPSDSPPSSGRTSSHPTDQAPSSAPSSRGGGTEVLPQPSSTATQTGLPLPKRPPQGPLVSVPLPRTAYEKGAIVVGYPTALRPPRRTTTETSSVSASNDVLQVALTARCTRPCDVLRHYRVTLGERGFHEVQTTAVANAPAAALQRGKDTVNVTVVATHRSTVEFDVLAILHAGA